MDTQIQLIPDERPLGVLRRVPLSQIDKSGLVGANPTKSFTGTVKRYGVLKTVLLIEKEDCTFKIADGRRRIKSSLLSEIEDVPAMVFDSSWTVSDVLTLIANSQSSDNPATDVRAIKNLLHGGAGEAEIAEATGMPIATVRKRLKLTALHDDLFEAFEAGQITVAVAEGCAKLSREKQEPLAAKLLETGKLTADDVHNALVVKTEAAVAGLPGALFETPAQKFEAAPSVSDEDIRLLSRLKAIAARRAWTPDQLLDEMEESEAKAKMPTKAVVKAPAKSTAKTTKKAVAVPKKAKPISVKKLAAALSIDLPATA